MKTLALCMIVKNEEEMLGGCLESIKDWVDEMIVVDTGSTDNTKQIAIDHGAKVFDFEWINDFAAARNFSKAQTQCDYVIALDADERFNATDGARLREELNAQDSMACFIRLSEAESITDTIEESIARSERQGSFTFLPRILKNVEGNDWVGRVHEGPLETLGATFIEVSFVHLGADLSYRESKNKSQRNLELLEAVYREDPDQFPLFYSYLALERQAVGDNTGFMEAMEIGWHKHLEHIEQSEGEVSFNSGYLNTYPSVLLAQGRFAEGFKTLNYLIKNLYSFATNAPNTLFQVVQSCLQINPPAEFREQFYEVVKDCAVFITEFHDDTFSEPTLPGVTTHKALLVQTLCLTKLGRFDEAMEKLQESYEYPESKYASDLMHVELLLEKKDLNQCFERYTDLLQKNLLTSPDVWVLGAVLLILLDQEDDARDYLTRSRNVNDLAFVSPHRCSLFKGLVVRNNVLIGEPTAGVGAYGVIGAILAREPVEVSHSIPSAIITKVVNQYIALNKVEKLLPFFDKRAESILPNCGQLVKGTLEQAGFIIEDDQAISPIILCGLGAEQLLPMFKDHPHLEVLTFSEAERNEILEDLSSREDSTLDDLLFGSMDDMLDDEEPLVVTIVSEKVAGLSKDPVFVWDPEWPIEYANDAFENGILVFFASNPLEYGDNTEQFHYWHLKNQDIFNGLQNWRFFLSAKMIQDEFPKIYSELMASLGAVLPDWSDEQFVELKNWDTSGLQETFSEDFDQEILKAWKLV